MCFRQKRVEQLLREVATIERRLSHKCRVEKSGEQNTGSLRLTFVLLDTRNKFEVEIQQLHFGYPYGELQWTFTNVFGSVTEEIVGKVIKACPKSFGYLTSICEALSQL